MSRRSAQPTVPVASDLMTAQEVMTELRCSRSFLSDHADEMGAVRLGNLWRVSRTDLDAWVARGRKAQPAEETEPTPIREPLDAPSWFVEAIASGQTNPVTGRPYGAAPRAGR